MSVKYKLYSDVKTFQHEHPAKQSAAAIARSHGVRNRIRKIAFYGACTIYRADKSAFTFSITEVY